MWKESQDYMQHMTHYLGAIIILINVYNMQFFSAVFPSMFNNLSTRSINKLLIAILVLIFKRMFRHLRNRVLKTHLVSNSICHKELPKYFLGKLPTMSSCWAQSWQSPKEEASLQHHYKSHKETLLKSLFSISWKQSTPITLNSN